LQYWINVIFTQTHGNRAVEKIWNVHFLFEWIPIFFKMYGFANLQNI